MDRKDLRISELKAKLKASQESELRLIADSKKIRYCSNCNMMKACPDCGEK